MKVAPSPPRTRWNLVAHIDASSPDIEPEETREVDRMERASKRHVDVSVQLRRCSEQRGRRMVGALGHAAGAFLTAYGALTASVAVVRSLPSPVGVLLAAAGLGLGWKLLKPQVDRSASELARATAPRIHREPAWRGTRTYHLGKDRTPGVIDARPIEQHRGHGAPTPEALGAFVAREMRRFPESRHAVLLSGHGLAWRNVVDLGLGDVAVALQHARDEAGRQPDLLILESCLMSNLEAMAMLEGSARFAVASEETMGADGLPWQRLLPRAGGNGQRFGRRIVRESLEPGRVDTLALIDLNRTGAVARAVEDLAQTLQPLVSTRRDEVRQAFTEAEPLPRRSAPGVPTGTLVDLGRLVARLHALDDPGVQEAAARVQAALDRAVIAHSATEAWSGTTGLSIQAPVPGLDTATYGEATGLRRWAGLLDSLA